MRIRQERKTTGNERRRVVLRKVSVEASKANISMIRDKIHEEQNDYGDPAICNLTTATTHQIRQAY